MHKVIKVVLVVFFLAGLLSFNINNVSACTCIQHTFQEMFDGSDSVFEGRVVNIDTPEDYDSGMQVKVTFQVLKVWKGEATTTVNVYTHVQTTACGYPFGDKPGDTYLVYAYKYEGQLSTSRCSRTHLWSDALGDLFMLNMENNRSGVFILVGSILIVFGGVIVFFLNKKKKITTQTG
jgi:hypothetical protein